MGDYANVEIEIKSYQSKPMDKGGNKIGSSSSPIGNLKKMIGVENDSDKLHTETYSL